MSKSLGNSPDLLELIDRFGADAVRFGIMIAAPAGNDLLFDESSCDQGRNFNNKVWNALKLVKMWEERRSESADPGNAASFAINWFQNRLEQVKQEVEGLYADFKLSEALKTIYSLTWNDFCSWYLEWVKPGFEQPISTEVYNKTVDFFTELLQLLHPFMPFITEEIYHQLKERSDDICIRQFSPFQKQDENILRQGQILQETISALRDARNKNNIKPKEAISLHILTDNETLFEPIKDILSKQVNADNIAFVKQPVSGGITVVVGTHKFFIETETVLDAATQKEQLTKDLDYLKGFLISVEKKLSNERFVSNAKPEVVDIERKKKADAEEKIKAIEESLAALGS